MTPEETRIQKARALRYKRAMVYGYSMDDIQREMYEIGDQLADWEFTDSETRSRVFDNNDDEISSFELSISEMQIELQRLQETLDDWYGLLDEDEYNDITVLLTGKGRCKECGEILGFDTVEEDYYGMSAFERKMAVDEAQKRLERLTKKELFMKIGIVSAFIFDWITFRQKYGYLDAELCVLTAECKANQKVTEEICNLYDLIMNDYPDRDTERKFEKIVSSLPDRAWVE